MEGPKKVSPRDHHITNSDEISNYEVSFKLDLKSAPFLKNWPAVETNRSTIERRTSVTSKLALFGFRSLVYPLFTAENDASSPHGAID